MGEEEHVMYILVNSNLKMRAGKIASQCAHSACRATRILENQKDTDYKEWIKNGEKKVVLKATEEQLLEMISSYNDKGKQIWCTHTYDSGKTQIPENSLTTVAFKPIKMKDRPELISTLKLL